MKPILPGALAAALILTPAISLARGTFEWGHYDSALYAYSKHPDKLPEFEKALQAAIDKGKASHHLAPGLQAELGYCLLEEGKQAQAMALFRAEMADFPESRQFLSKFVPEGAAQ